jgi:hypothetical protein
MKRVQPMEAMRSEWYLVNTVAIATLYLLMGYTIIR